MTKVYSEEELREKRKKACEYQKARRLKYPEKYKEKDRLSKLKDKEKNALREKQNRLDNPDHYKAINKRSYLKRKDKIAERKKLDRLNNPEKYKEIRRRYLENNKERVRSIRLKWNAENADKIAFYTKYHNDKNNAKNYERDKEKRTERRRTDPEYNERCNRWAKNNKDKRCAMASKRRAKKLKATPSWLTDKDWNDINRFYKVSAYLTKATGIKYTVDHIHPLQGKEICGLHVPWNMQILTDKENTSKGNRLYL